MPTSEAPGDKDVLEHPDRALTNPDARGLTCSEGVPTPPGSTSYLAWLSYERPSSLELTPVAPIPGSQVPRSPRPPRGPGVANSRYWQRSPRKPGRHRHWGWLPWLTVQVLLLAQ